MGWKPHLIRAHGLPVGVDDPRRGRRLAVDHDVGPVVLRPGRGVPERNVQVSVDRYQLCIQGDLSARRLGYVGTGSVSYRGYPEMELMSA